MSDLVGLFGKPDQPYEFRQGVVVAFDAAIGLNQVLVAGAVLEDLPVIEGSGVVNLTAGDTVLLVRMRSSWAILGRVLSVGSSEFASAAVAFDQNQNASTDNFALAVGTFEYVSFSLTVPEWANEALVTATATASILNNASGATRGLAAGVEIDGVGGAFGSATSVPNNLQGSSSTTRSRIISSPGPLITIGGLITATFAHPANAANQIALTATAIFRRV